METNKGFTLIESIVAVGIFVVLLTVFSGFFVSAIQAQRRALASQELIDNASYVLEYMSRSIRMARKDLEGVCITEENNYELTRNKQGIKFKNYEDKCQEFYLENNRLRESKNGTENYLTPAKFEVSRFTIKGSETWGQERNEDELFTQPKVTIYLKIEELEIQTTISQRDLNVER